MLYRLIVYSSFIQICICNYNYRNTLKNDICMFSSVFLKLLYPQLMVYMCNCYIVSCVGILEMVTGAETLRSIETSHGLAGALNEKRLAEWLMKHNNTDVAYKKV